MDPNDSFREFMAAHQQSLMRTAYLLTGDAHLAEDLLQSVLLKVLSRWPKLADVASPQAYARKALINQYISWRRRLARATELPRAEPPDRPYSTEDSTVVRIAMLRALAQLPPRQRAVIVLRYYEDLTEHETAKLLRCSLGTVKSHAHHVLARLRVLAPELAPKFAETEDLKGARR
ncbi:RNA polymerase sigma-E factor [Nonomuraea coxensis DSM 45129]|uniref:RNA polymerase sigma-E factor n=1 Tax=Nonomuraea coxensis DSM 45129 TaxID=1122611 RepID=A0ABX8U264_9ACTN|nr:SigE family RNA polymerase sigma factor [Nonomuraea coxensis]QYC41750.1 RNA polymerase sigma-E factor [Nonomuraea coxensis DSM 45129]